MGNGAEMQKSSLCQDIHLIFREKGFWDNNVHGNQATVFCELDHLSIEIYELFSSSVEGICEEAADVFIVLADIVGAFGKEVDVEYTDVQEHLEDKDIPSYFDFMTVKSALSDIFRKKGYICLVESNKMIYLLFEYCNYKNVDLLKCVEEKMNKNRGRPYRFGLNQ